MNDQELSDCQRQSPSKVWIDEVRKKSLRLKFECYVYAHASNWAGRFSRAWGMNLEINSMVHRRRNRGGRGALAPPKVKLSDVIESQTYPVFITTAAKYRH